MCQVIISVLITFNCHHVVDDKLPFLTISDCVEEENNIVAIFLLFLLSLFLSLTQHIYIKSLSIFI